MEEGSFNRTRVLRGWAVGAGEGAQRLLEAVSSESSRVAGLGPALFAVIFFLVIVIALCGAANFIDNPGPRKALRGAAAALIVLPVLFFASATYVNDSSQIVANRVSLPKKAHEQIPKNLGPCKRERKKVSKSIQLTFIVCRNLTKPTRLVS
mmetsp:Transcript_4828/g.9086  ORF Transcript_4828/g.9086 Transcript_4828/m.9086 type:complete len:152 (-) Transcript_4828:125-580(-)